MSSFTWRLILRTFTVVSHTLGGKPKLTITTVKPRKFEIRFLETLANSKLILDTMGSGKRAYYELFLRGYIFQKLFHA